MLLAIYNILRWIILLLLVLSILQAFTGWQKKRELRLGDTRLWLFTMISVHITLLIGIFGCITGAAYLIAALRFRKAENTLDMMV